MLVWACLVNALACVGAGRAGAEMATNQRIEGTAFLQGQRLNPVTTLATEGTLKLSWGTVAAENKVAALSRLQEGWSNMADALVDTVSNTNLGVPAFTYTVPANDSDSWQPKFQGVLEPAVSYHMVQDAGDCCKNGGHFLDVGGNYGWFSLLGAAMGCHTDTIEPVPLFADLLEYNKVYNNPHLSNLITLHRGMIAGDKVGVQRTLSIPRVGIFGTASVDGAAVTEDNLKESLTVEETTVDSFNFNLDLAPCVMKVDVEGFEPYVFNGSQSYLKRRPQVIAIELSPGYSKKWDKTNSMLLQMLENIVGAGYTPHLLFWDDVKSQDWAAIQADMSTYSYSGDPQSMVEKCAADFNCMVYFKRHG